MGKLWTLGQGKYLQPTRKDCILLGHTVHTFGLFPTLKMAIILNISLAQRNLDFLTSIQSVIAIISEALSSFSLSWYHGRCKAENHLWVSEDFLVFGHFVSFLFSSHICVQPEKLRIIEAMQTNCKINEA